MRVGIEFAFTDEEWIGGVKATSNLLHALARLEHPRIRPVVIAGMATPNSLLEDLPKLERLRTSLVDRTSYQFFARRALKKALGFDPLMECWLRANGVDVLFNSTSLGRRASIPTIGYIADFSYRYFKELYTPETWTKKDVGSARVCNEFDTLLLSSHAVAADYKKFFPEASAKAAVLHFVPSQTLAIEELPELSTLVSRYGIPSKFLYTPNQFWVHKNHRAIIEALSLVASEGHDIHIVSTGLTKDVRKPEYFAELMQDVQRRGLGDRFHVLGLVRYEDAIALMRNCVGVISASLSEGWGLTVAEAKLIGKTVILSDIPVFREQSPDYGLFFNPSDPKELAHHLVSVWDAYSREEDLRRQMLAKAHGEAVLRRYARGFEDIVLETAGRRKRMSFQPKPA